MSWKARATYVAISGLSLCAMGCSSDSESTTPAGFALTSSSFKSGDEIPAQFTCEGKPFGEGISPELHWTAGPATTTSFALLFKDTTLVPDDHGYHWAMWKIPASARSLPEGMGADQYPPWPAGSEQCSGYLGPRAAEPEPFQFLGPCPSWMATQSGNDANRSHDSYSFTLYALSTDPLDLPVNDDPNANYPHALDDYFDSIQIGKAELLGKSDAKPSAVPF